MTRYMLMALVVGLLLAACPATKEDEAKKEVEKLQGKWQCISVEAEGQTLPEDVVKIWSLTFKNDLITLWLGDEPGWKGKFTLDPSKKPKAIDVTLMEIDGKKVEEKVILGIYEVDKNGLKLIARAARVKERPAEFVTKKDTEDMLFKCKKDKPYANLRPGRGIQQEGWTMNSKPSLLSRRRVILALIAFVVSWYAGSYWRGMTMGYIEHTCGYYEIKVWYPLEPWQGEYMRLLRERYGVAADTVSDYMVLPTTEWYAEGYNSVSRPLLIQKYGKDIFAECEGETRSAWQADHPGEW